jgi:hypothetical protein
MEYESLSGSEVVDLISNRKISQLKRSQKPSRVLQAIPPSKPVRPSEIPIPVPPPTLSDPAPEPLSSSNASDDAVVNKTEQMNKNSLVPPSPKLDSSTIVKPEELSNTGAHSSSQPSQKAGTQRGPPKI